MATLNNLRTRASAVASLFAVVLCLVQPCAAQVLPEPEREQLLNGLPVLLWPTPGSNTVIVKLRIHSGAAFDLAGRAGEMAVLGDILFPDPATYDYFTDEMGGHLEVNVTYDSTTITMEGKANQLENIIEVLRSALLATQLTPEIVTRVRDTRIKIIRESAVSPATVADRAIATRLFGDFPYGRPAGGSVEELARVDRSDLMLAKERFLNSNNATLAVIGGITKARALRTLRQLLGPWRKSEQVVPTTFRQPKPADPRTLIVAAPAQTAELRLAVRGLARSDADAVTARLLATIAYHRWVEMFPLLARKAAFVRSETHVLPGMFLVGTAVEEANVADAIISAKKVFESLVQTAPSGAELQNARNEVIAEIASLNKRQESALDPWLDRDTYRLPSVPDEVAMLQAVSPNDVQRVASRLFKESSIASVVIGDPVHLKAVLEGRFPYEVLGETPAPTPAAKPPAKPVGTPTPG